MMIELKFKFKGNLITHSFEPKESDQWTGFKIMYHSFDVHYDEDSMEICVYEYSDGRTKTETTLHSQKIIKPLFSVNHETEFNKHFERVEPKDMVTFLSLFRKGKLYAFDLRDGSDFLLEENHNMGLLDYINSPDFIFGTEKVKENEQKEILIIMDKGIIQRVDNPDGLKLTIRDYDIEDCSEVERIEKDEDGNEYIEIIF